MFEAWAPRTPPREGHEFTRAVKLIKTSALQRLRFTLFRIRRVAGGGWPIQARFWLEWAGCPTLPASFAGEWADGLSLREVICFSIWITSESLPRSGSLMSRCTCSGITTYPVMKQPYQRGHVPVRAQKYLSPRRSREASAADSS